MGENPRGVRSAAKSNLCKRCETLERRPPFDYCSFCLDVIVREWESWQQGAYEAPEPEPQLFKASDGSPLSVLPFVRPTR